LLREKGSKIEKPRVRTNIGWILGALVLTFVLYYLLETVFFIVGDLAVGAVNLENSGATDWRILLLPLAGYIVFRVLWSRIRTSRAA
jgi:H+/Cl- antiporter ClcA